MPLGAYNNTGLGVSEWAVPNDSAKIACSIPTGYDKAQGQMDFLKRTAGGEIYIGLCGKKASAQQYDIVLTDASPTYNVGGLALGDIYVFGSVANLKLSINILACT